MSALGFRGYWPQSLNRHTPKLSGSRAFQCQVTQIRVQKNSWFWGVFLHKIDVTYILKAGMTINLVYLGTLDVHPVTRPSDFCGNELAVWAETLSYGSQGNGRINQESWLEMSNDVRSHQGSQYLRVTQETKPCFPSIRDSEGNAMNGIWNILSFND